MLAEVTYNIANSLLFVVPFAYLDKKHVHIFVDNKEINTYIWQTNTSILLEELAGKKLLIKRNTPLSDYSFRFIEATALTAEVLNVIYLQHLYVLEELNDLIDKIINNPELIGNLKIQIDKLKAQEKVVNDNIKKIKDLIQNTNKNIADKIRDNNKIVSKVNDLLKKVSDTLKEIKKIHGDITSKNIYPLKIFNADGTKHIIITPDEKITKNYNLTLPEDAPQNDEVLKYDASKSSFVWAKPIEEKKEFIELNSKSGHQVRIYPAANLQKDMKINLGDDVFKLCSSIDKTAENNLITKIDKNKNDISTLETSVITQIKALKLVDDTFRRNVNTNTTDIAQLKARGGGGGTTTTTNVALATETIAGKAEIATQDEANDGTDDSRIVTPKKLKTITRDLDSRATRIRHDVDRNTADLVTHRTDIQQNTTDIVSNTSSIATIISTLKKGITTTDKLAQSFTVPSVLHDKIQLDGEENTGNYGYSVAINYYHLAIADTVNQEVVIYHRNDNNKKLWELEDVHKGKKHGDVFVEDGQVYVKRKDGVHLDVFNYDETQANLTFKKVATITLTDSYGKSLAVDDDYLIVGNPQAKTALIYEHSGINWHLVKKLTGGNSFGGSVAVNNKYILVSEVANKKVEAYTILRGFDFSTKRVTGRFKVKSDAYINAPAASTTGFIGYTVADDDGVNFYQVVMAIGTTTAYTRTYTATTNGAYATTNIDWFYQLTNVNAMGSINQSKNPRIYFIENNKLYVGVYLEGAGEWALIYKDVSTNQIYTTYDGRKTTRNEIGVIFTEKDFNMLMSRTNRTYYRDDNQEANKEITDRFYHSEGSALAYGGDDHAYFSILEKNGTKKQCNVTEDSITPTCFVRIKGLIGTWGAWSNANGTRPADPIQLEVVSTPKTINHFKTITGGASFCKLIDLADDLYAFAEPDNNILKIYENLAEIASKTVKADCVSVSAGIVLATSKTDKKAYIYDFYSKTGWFTTTKTKWAGLPDNAQGYTSYNITGGQYQLVRPTGTTDTYTKYRGGEWVKNGNWGGVLFYDGAKIGLGKVATGTGKISITDTIDVGVGYAFVDSSGQWWMGTNNAGIGRFNTTTGKLTITDTTDVRYGFGFVDASGQWWVAALKGIGRFNTTTGKIAITDNIDAHGGFAFVDSSGQWWVGTKDDGIGKFNTTTGKITITDATNVWAGFAFVDRSGQWWVGTGGSGIGRFNTNTGKITITDSTNVQEGFGIVDSSGQAWVGTARYRYGMGRFNTTTGKITITDSTTVTAGFAFLDASGQVWIGASYVFGRLDTNTGKIIVTDKTRMRFGFGFVDASGQAWVATRGNGIGRLDTDTKKQLYLDTSDGKHYYNNKEVTDATKFDSIMQDAAPLPTLPNPIVQANRNLKLTHTDIQEQPNKTGNYVSLLGIGTATTPTDITKPNDTNFTIDNNFGDACAITTDKILITNKTDSKLAIYDHVGTKQKEIQLEAGLGSVIAATDIEAVVGSEKTNSVDIINLS